MKAIINLQTFPPGANQGTWMEVGKVAMEVETVTLPVTKHNGCFAPEIVNSTTEVKTIMLAGRRFIVSEASQAFNSNKGCDYMAHIPQDVAAQIKMTKCPCCGCGVLV